MRVVAVSGRLIVLAAFVAALLAPAAAEAAITDVFGGDVICAEQPDGVRFCGSSAPRSTTETFDGVPIDVNAAFPPAPTSGPDGPYPLVMMFHGYGGHKLGLSDMQSWLDRGYAAFSMTDRGFHESCGTPASRLAAPICDTKGYVRLMDTRYEVRDAQLFAGELADEGLVKPRRIGAVGGSYGGGMSMALAALRDRVMMPSGKLVPWKSPDGKAMAIAAAAPSVPWTDLAYSLAPNGSTLDYLADAPYVRRVGVMKQSYVNGLYYGGLLAPGFYAAAGQDPGADLTGWKTLLEAGEPYGPAAQGIIDELDSHHSSYYIDHSEPPAPLLMSSGFTDDLFPADETIRYFNRTTSEYPGADVALFFGDFGHMRGQNKPRVTNVQSRRVNAWIDHYVLGSGPKPRPGVEAFTQTCPDTEPDGGPYRAPTWARMAPGEVRIGSRPDQVIDSGSNTGGQFNPVPDGKACATVPDAAVSGAATYELDPAPRGGYTLMGAATVIADFTLRGTTSQVAARLLDVAPGGTETLVARGLWRPDDGGPERQAFQLHPNGWTFAAGHVPRLELIASDSTGNPASSLGNYGRPSNGQRDVTVGNLELRLPVIERPGALGGVVKAPAKKRLRGDQELAAAFAALKHPRAELAGKRLRAGRGNRVLTARVRCPGAFAACTDGRLEITAKSKRHGEAMGFRFRVGSARFARAAGGATVKLRVPVAKGPARRFLKRSGKLRVTTAVSSAETKGAARGSALVIARR